MLGNQISLTNNVAKQVISVTATQGQTDFTVEGGYRINQLGVYRNGVRLVDGRDFIARNGATVTLLSQGANGSDAMEFVVFDDFRVADALSVNAGGTVNASVNITGALQMGTGTSIFSPANNVLTLGTNSAERVRIKSDGFVGIGTDNPTRVVHVQDDSNTLLALDSTDTNSDLVQSDTGGSTRIRSDSGALEFYTGGDASSTNATNSQARVRVSAGGSVGISESNPQALLHLNDGANSAIMLGNTTNGYKLRANVTGSNDYGFLIEDEDGVDLYRLTSSTGTTDPNTHRFYTGGTERVRISADGRVGIGTTIPGAFLDAQVSNANTVLQLKRTDAPAKITSNFGGGDSALKYTVNDASSFLVGIDDSDGDKFKLSFGSSDDAAFGTKDRIVVHQDGKVAIGTDTASHAFNVMGESSETEFKAAMSESGFVANTRAGFSAGNDNSAGVGLEFILYGSDINNTWVPFSLFIYAASNATNGSSHAAAWYYYRCRYFTNAGTPLNATQVDAGGDTGSITISLNDDGNVGTAMGLSSDDEAVQIEIRMSNSGGQRSVLSAYVTSYPGLARFRRQP